MEDRELLKRRTRSVLVRAQVAGALAGAVITVATDIIVWARIHSGARHPIDWAIGYLWALVLRPANRLCHILGLGWPVDSAYAASPVQLVLPVLVNSVLLLAVASAIALCLPLLRKILTHRS